MRAETRFLFNVLYLQEILINFSMNLYTFVKHKNEKKKDEISTEDLK